MNKKVLKFDLSTFINLVNFCINASLMSYRDVKYLEYILLQQLKQYLFQKIHISVEKCNVSTFFILVIFFINALLMNYRDVKYLAYSWMLFNLQYIKLLNTPNSDSYESKLYIQLQFDMIFLQQNVIVYTYRRNPIKVICKRLY